MKVMGPDGYREYRWDDPNEMPVEVGKDIPPETYAQPPAYTPPFDPGVNAGGVVLPPVQDAAEDVDPGSADASEEGTIEEDSPFDA
jgi:hypothetical protein